MVKTTCPIQLSHWPRLEYDKTIDIRRIRVSPYFMTITNVWLEQ